MSKKRLLTPGPTQVPEAARLALARDVLHHRTPEFRALFAEALEGLKEVFQTRNDVVVLASSGTGGMEAAVVNFAPRGSKVLVIEGGVFAERWTHLCRAFGVEVVRHEIPWGRAADPSEVAALLAKHPDAVAVFGTLMESSTGVAHDIEALGRVVKATQALFVVDGISGAGAIECRTDDWGVDVLVVGSQKALMLPPGLAFLTISEAAWRRLEQHEPAAFYFNLNYYRKKLHGFAPGEGPDTPFTPASGLVAALVESVRIMRAEGMPAIWRRNCRLAAAMRAGVAAIGLELFAARPADGMTAVCFPSSVDGGKFLKQLEAKFGIKLASGQLSLKGKIFRIAHFGLIDELDILGTLAAIELTLIEFGCKVTLGTATAAASQVFSNLSHVDR
jgi:aspartate aminotransferase-like enzyme